MTTNMLHEHRDVAAPSDPTGHRRGRRRHPGGVRRLWSELYRFALRALRDEGAAEDAVQETFLRAWRSARRYDPALASLRAWLYAILRNVVIDAVRRRTGSSWRTILTDREALERGLDPVADPAEQLMVNWTVEEALRRISEDHRHAIVETYLRGRPYEDVAAERGVPVTTMRSRVFYALRALRSAMDEMGVKP